MPRESLPDLSIVLTFLRGGQGWSQAELGEAAGISPKLLNDYERGRKTLHRSRLEHLIAFMGLEPERIDAALALLAANRASSRAPADSAGRSSEANRRAETVAARFGNLATSFARSSLSLLTSGGEALHAREDAEILWKRLERRTATDRRRLVEMGTKFRTWALCERVAAESIRKAPNHPREALELAELARLIAERVPGDHLWRLRLQGYAWAHVANARRACNDLAEADEAMTRARPLWETGAPADSGLLNAAWVPGLEAALRRAQRRFSQALKRIDEALALDPEGELLGEILLAKSNIQDALGDPESSTLTLLKAVPFIDPGRQPRNAFGLRFNLLVDLCQLGRAAEAGPRLAEVRALAERLGGELDLTRTVWLEGKVAAGLGRFAEARGAFGQVRRVFLQHELAFDYALVSLDLALLLLEQGRTGEVKMLAEEMLRIFRTQKIEREALAALRVFCEAARQETATAELARRVLKFLHRAQHDPELQFETEPR